MCSRHFLHFRSSRIHSTFLFARYLLATVLSPIPLLILLALHTLSLCSLCRLSRKFILRHTAILVQCIRYSSLLISHTVISIHTISILIILLPFTLIAFSSTAASLLTSA
ncbi:membrane protein [gut metagenome]|uniref:Membrane protein n=1 Tax=gut metagenome TaxID=749906 RepID=J9GFP1_9ZZZZ